MTPLMLLYGGAARALLAGCTSLALATAASGWTGGLGVSDPMVPPGEARDHSTPVVSTDLGMVRGTAIGDGGAAFRGLPYAAPPIGPLRWREAQPIRPWAEIRDATSFGAICPQPANAATQDLPQSEDCLTLNIVTPDLHGRDLPVLFSIHGGAFVVGSGRYIADQDLSPMVRRGVVIVSANYRIGRLGFFAHPALTREAGRGTGNFWLSDQLAALTWVRRNIAMFGGNPDRITILGCSAGGSSVNALLASPAARGLFARASVHSGGGMFNASRTLERAERQGIDFAAAKGIAEDDPAALDRLRALSVEQLLATDAGPPDYGAIVDGALIRRPVAIDFAAGERAPVPLIVGSTSNEASVFGVMGFDAETLKTRFGIELAALRPLYERDGPIDEAELLRRVQTDFIFTSASLGLAGLAAGGGPTWSYHFDYVPAAARGAKPGASHCADMPYIFADDPRRSAEDRAVAEQQQLYWYNFIAHGDPNGPGLPPWPRLKAGEIAPRVVGTESRIVPGFNQAIMDHWHARWRREAAIGDVP